MHLSDNTSRSRKPFIIFLSILSVLLFITAWHSYSPTHPTDVYRTALKAAKQKWNGLAVEQSINNSTLGFGALLVLNMPSRTDHRDDLQIAGSLSNLHFDFIDGVKGADVDDKALTAVTNRTILGNGNVGSWRAHMNALYTVVERNLSSALILEDDVDWDVRIKDQMQDFAAASRVLTQPLKSGGYIDPTFKNRDSDPEEIQPLMHDLNTERYGETKNPQTSPYGDDWDILWLGHCGARFPKPEQHMPKGRVAILEDLTVPSWRTRYDMDDDIQDWYPEDHTRVIHHAMGPICTFAYAVSLNGARRILHNIGVRKFDAAFDNLLAEFCDTHTCLTSQPAYFTHYRAPGPVNRDSDINSFENTEMREKGVSQNIRLSTRVGIEELLNGANPMELEDQFPD